MMEDKNMVSHNSQLTTLQVVSDGGEVLLSCDRMEKQDSSFAQKGGAVSDAVLHLLSRTLPLMADGTYRVGFSPATTQGLAQGTLKLMGGDKVVAINAITGKTVEHAKILGTINPAQLASLGWAVGSMVFAQKHLQDIAHELKEIKQDIQQIKQWQDDKDISALRGRAGWLQEDFFQSFESRSANAEWRALKKLQLAECTRELYTLQDDLSLKTARLKKETETLFNADGSISGAFDTDTFGTKTAFEKLKKLCAEAEDLQKRYQLLCQLVALVNMAVRLLDPERETLSYLKLKSVCGRDLNAALENINRVSTKVFSFTHKLGRNVAATAAAGVVSLGVGAVLGIGRLVHSQISEAKRPEEISKITESIQNGLKLAQNHYRTHVETLKSLPVTPAPMMIQTDSTGKILRAVLLENKISV